MAAVTLLTFAGLPVTASATTAAGPTPTPPKRMFTIRDERVQEPTGLAKSVKHEDTYYAVSNTGNSSRVFALDGDGRVEAVLRFNADVKDIEAAGVDRDGNIYIADIGDNSADRDMIEIYTIPEPAKLQDQELRYHRFDFTYPDGAHDAETLLIEPGTNQLYIVTKSTKGPGAIYAAPPAPSRQGTNELSKLAPAPSGVITDGAFLPDGQRAVLRTTTGLATVGWGDTPNAIARSKLSLGQGETVALGPTDESVVVAGAETPAVYQVQVPAPKAASKPSASPTPKGTSNADANSGGAGKSHNLRWIVIGAALFALVITVVTFPPGRRERLDRQAENARLTGQSPPAPRRHHVQ